MSDELKALISSKKAVFDEAVAALDGMIYKQRLRKIIEGELDACATREASLLERIGSLQADIDSTTRNLGECRSMRDTMIEWLDAGCPPIHHTEVQRVDGSLGVIGIGVVAVVCSVFWFAVGFLVGKI